MQNSKAKSVKVLAEISIEKFIQFSVFSKPCEHLGVKTKYMIRVFISQAYGFIVPLSLNILCS